MLDAVAAVTLVGPASGGRPAGLSGAPYLGLRQGWFSTGAISWSGGSRSRYLSVTYTEIPNPSAPKAQAM